MRISTLLPAPFGPRITLRGPASNVMSTSSRIGAPPATAKPTPWSVSGRMPARPSAMIALRALAQPVCEDVEQQHDREQDDPQPERERKVALRRLERDGRGHHARDAVDVAADDHHRAHLGDRAPERREDD